MLKYLGVFNCVLAHFGSICKMMSSVYITSEPLSEKNCFEDRTGITSRKPPHMWSYSFKKPNFCHQSHGFCTFL